MQLAGLLLVLINTHHAHAFWGRRLEGPNMLPPSPTNAPTVAPTPAQSCDGLDDICDRPSWAHECVDSETDICEGALTFAPTAAPVAAPTLAPVSVCDGLDDICDRPSWAHECVDSETDICEGALTFAPTAAPVAAPTLAPVSVCDGLDDICDRPSWAHECEDSETDICEGALTFAPTAAPVAAPTLAPALAPTVPTDAPPATRSPLSPPPSPPPGAPGSLVEIVRAVITFVTGGDPSDFGESELDLIAQVVASNSGPGVRTADVEVTIAAASVRIVAVVSAANASMVASSLGAKFYSVEATEDIFNTSGIALSVEAAPSVSTVSETRVLYPPPPPPAGGSLPVGPSGSSDAWLVIGASAGAAAALSLGGVALATVCLLWKRRHGSVGSRKKPLLKQEQVKGKDAKVGGAGVALVLHGARQDRTPTLTSQI